MRSAVFDIMPNTVRRGLKQLGHDLALARKKRGLTVVMMAERLGVGKTTYLRVEKGDGTVSMGVYAMAFFVLGFDNALNIADPARDTQGILLDEERMPQRVRVKKEPQPR